MPSGSEGHDLSRGHAAVRLAQTEAEREAVCRLRYDVYIDEMGKQSIGADHQSRQLVDEVDPGSDLHYVAEGDEILGTLRRTFCRDGGAFGHSRPVFALDRFTLAEGQCFSMSSRFAINPRWRQTWVITGLCLAAYQRGRKQGVAYDFLTTNPSLVPLYERLGYRRYHHGFCADDVGYQLPMVLMALDYAHLRAVRSPYMEVAQHWPGDPRQTGWLQEEFPAARRYYGVPAGINRPKAPPVEVLNAAERVGLDESVTSVLWRLGYVHTFDAGDVLLRVGDLCYCAYLPIEGDLSQHDPVSGRAHGASLAGIECLMSPYRSQSRTTCRTPVRALVLPGEALRLLAAREPALGAFLAHAAPVHCLESPMDVAC